MNKLCSGRFLLTVISGSVFAYAVVTKLLDSQATASIITLVFMAYFSRKRPEGGQDKD